MGRTADYTIKGFLYQFNLTLLKILESQDNDEITVEGIIEDIDVNSNGLINAIQCKYHETKEKYTLSNLYKPILQMMVHYCENQNENENIKYTLYAHFSDEECRKEELTIDELKAIFKTENKEYISKYISKIVVPKCPNIQNLIAKDSNTKAEKDTIASYYIENLDELDPIIRIESFIEKFELVLGESFEEICEKSKSKLESSDLSGQDIEDLFYPNSIQQIADLSVLHSEEDRVIKKSDFIKNLKHKKRTAITRWTLELKSYKKIMDKRRMQINSRLKNNSKVVNFILDAESIEDFDEELITFINDYNLKYNYKIELHETPMFCLDGLTKLEIDIDNLEERLYRRNISYENGMRGKRFFKDALMREPKKIPRRKGQSDWKEFSIRFTRYSDYIVDTINTFKPNILFIISEKKYEDLDTQDVELEELTIRNFNELKYLLKLSDSLENN